MTTQKTFYITTPIYYPSGQLHIGHVYSTTIAWSLRNYKKLQGYKTKFLTGADEHGQKIANKAKQLNLQPQHYVNQMSKQFEDLWTIYEIDYDYFSRTSNSAHIQTVSRIFTKLLQTQNIYLDYYEGFYSVADEEFFTKTQAKLHEGQYYHPTSNHPLSHVKEVSYFLNIKKYEQWLSDYWQSHPNFIMPVKVVNELRNNFLNHGLEDLSITRTTFDWGVKVAENPSHVVYVWLDALTNYLSALGYDTKHDDDYQTYWKNGIEIVHVVGKEISRFHGIYWPIMLNALNLRQPNSILAHGWIITPEGKMSKSKGNVVNPYDLLKTFEVETIKYYLASQIHLGHDGIFSLDLVKSVHNADLANNFGNLLSRTTTLVAKHFPDGLKKISSYNKTINKQITDSFAQYIFHLDNYEISEGLKIAIHLSKIFNNYIEQTTPWNLTNDLETLNDVLINLCNGIYAIASMLQIVMPKKMTLVQNYLGLLSLSFTLINDFDKFIGIKIDKNKPLFDRLK